MLMTFYISRIKIGRYVSLLFLAVIIFPLVTPSHVQALAYESSSDSYCTAWSMDQYSINPESVDFEPLGVVLEGGSVLGAVISSDCGGYDVGISDMACASSSTEIGFKGPLTDSAVSFDENCRINVLQASIPTFFMGCDPNKDGRIDTFGDNGACELPPIADFYGNTFETKVEKGETIQGDKFHQTFSVFYEPNSGKKYTTPVEGEAKASFKPDVVGSDGNAKILDTEGLGSNGTSNTSSYSCNGFWGESSGSGESPAGSCESWVGSNDPLNKSVAKMFVPPSSPGVKVIQRSGSTSCSLPSVGAKYRISCINLEGYVQGWVANFTGAVSRAKCVIDSVTGIDLNCKRNVVITLSTQNVIGSNASKEDSSPDKVMDTFVSSTRPPGLASSTCGYSEPGGQFAPCWTDDYVYTPAVCEVCGKHVKCFFIWKNYVKDHFERAKPEKGPCTGKCCDYQTYWDEIQKCVGGINPDFVAL